MDTLFEYSKRDLDVNLQYQVNHFIHQVSINPAVIDDDGFFALGKAMIPGIFGITVTYILLEIQLDI